MTHVIAKKDLRGSRDQNDRAGESVERLMAAIARLEIEREGKRYIRRVQLLGATDEGREEDGLLYYRFPAELRAIIRNSSIFARLRMDVMFALSSKYALTLYEAVQKRGNLDWKRGEEFTVERFRQLLGVEPGKLESFKNLNKWAIQPAVAEVNGLSDFGCAVEPVLAGRKVIKIRLSWWTKNVDQLKAAYCELRASKVGRRARLRGTAEQIVSPSDRAPAIVPEHFQKTGPAALAHAEPVETTAGAAPLIEEPPGPVDSPPTEGVLDPRATLERIRAQRAADRKRERQMEAERLRREQESKAQPLSGDDKE